MARKQKKLNKSTLSSMVAIRESGETISQTAHRLGVNPWLVSYRTRFVKACVTTDEYLDLEETAKSFGMTVGELLVDCYNTSADKYVRGREKKYGKSRKKLKAVG